MHHRYGRCCPYKLDHFLHVAGPLPKIKGIPDLATTPTTEPGTSNIQLPPTVDSDVQDLIKYLKKYETISGDLAVKFMSVYKIEPVELSKIMYVLSGVTINLY